MLCLVVKKSLSWTTLMERFGVDTLTQGSGSGTGPDATEKIEPNRNYRMRIAAENRFLSRFPMFHSAPLILLPFRLDLFSSRIEACP